MGPGPIGQKGEKGAPNGMIDGRNGHDGIPGADGDRGIKGAKGDTAQCGGAVYIRWGRTSCQSGQGTELVYSGRGGGSHSDNSGGGANHLCMPDDPEYMQYEIGVQGCAVCYTGAQVTVMMIPVKIHCPSGWTVEYTGYLMSEGSSDTRSNYECVDHDPQSVPGLGGLNVMSFLSHVEPVCSGSCPPYYAERELTCVVCSR